MALELRPYQVNAVQKLKSEFAAQRRPILSAPTGSGKTEIVQAVAEAYASAQRPALIVCDREVLVAQTMARFSRHGHLVGVIQADNTFVRGYESIVVASIQTLRSRWNRELQRGAGITAKEFVQTASLVAIDECHILHQAHQRVLQAVDRGTPLLGLTATPLRDGLGTMFDSIVSVASIAQLQADGYLVRSKTYAPRVEDLSRGLESLEVRAGDYVADQLSALMRERAIIGDVVSSYIARGGDRPAICFAVDRAHARDLQEAFTIASVAAGYVDGRTSAQERQRL